MENSTRTPVVKDLVLVGGGHSHVHVLKNFRMKPMPGVRVTLVTSDVMTPYSGMLPGWVAGHYSYDECHIDLQRLARFAGARLMHARANGLNLQGKQVQLEGRPPILYDVLSLDIGSTPSSKGVENASEHTTPVKPIYSFGARWHPLIARVVAATKPMCIAMVGGGPAGVELTLSMDHRLRKELQAVGKPPDLISFSLFTRSKLLSRYNETARSKMARILKQRGVAVHSNTQIARVAEGVLYSADGTSFPFDECIWCTQASAQEWLGSSGLASDPDGFVYVDECLQAVKQLGVFAAGDVSASLIHPRPKAGVFAVRALFSPTAECAPVFGRTGDQYALAHRSGWCFEGGWLWTVKDYIDRAWMAKYTNLPAMQNQQPQLPAVAVASGAHALSAITTAPMRCGGCGSKIGSSVLSRVLARLDVPTRPEVLVGLDSPDDAAVVKIPDGMVTVHTVDFFRSFIEDTYTFGSIAANHALGDCYAMGAQPLTALAIATVPHGLDSKVEEELYQLLAGALQVLKSAGCALVGGHSAEGIELSLGFSVTGVIDPTQLMRKGGMQVGDVLIITKPIGTGTLFAADMQSKARGSWISEAVASMLQSQQDAGSVFMKHGASACTDVTGFGLLGHLVEMIKASQVDVSFNVSALPILTGAVECTHLGIFSSLHPDNIRLSRAISNIGEASSAAAYPLLFDPQTAGPLLASVPAEEADSCLSALRQAGYTQAAVIGKASCMPLRCVARN
eukprot:jgi/Chlat1/7711/Chrsp66S07189